LSVAERVAITSNLASIETALGWANAALRVQKMQSGLCRLPDDLTSQRGHSSRLWCLDATVSGAIMARNHMIPLSFFFGKRRNSDWRGMIATGFNKKLW
jgi:hypothetical protein